MKIRVVLLILLSLLISCSKKVEEEGKAHEQHAQKESYYTCSMHPQVRESKPGNCPICHMKLTKIEVEPEEKMSDSAMAPKTYWVCESDHSVNSESETICPLDGKPMIEIEKEQPATSKVTLSDTQVAHFDARVFPVQTMKMSKEVRLLGQVVQAQQKESNIPLRIDGRVERVFIKSEGEFVKRGQPVVEIYSPTLISAGEEYIIARKQAGKNAQSRDFKDLLKQSEERLSNWGVTKEQREKWFRDGAVEQLITIYSSTSGIVTKRFAVNGRYFKEGQSLFDLVDLSTVWVELDVYEVDAALVSSGQELEMRFSALPGTVKKGELDFVSPVIDDKTRTLKVRATIDNSDGMLKLGMVVDGRLVVDLSADHLVIPRAAVVDTGKRQIVWVKISERTYEARLVELGRIAGDYVQVITGLSDQDQVVERGNFLLDAQAQLFGTHHSH